MKNKHWNLYKSLIDTCLYYVHPITGYPQLQAQLRFSKDGVCQIEITDGYKSLRFKIICVKPDKQGLIQAKSEALKLLSMQVNTLSVNTLKIA